VTTPADLPILPFASAADWRAWLEEHHATSPGLWIRIYKKAAGVPSVDYAGALDEALCYGWIDSTKRSYDDASFLQRFSPRKARSAWSKVNRDHVARLEAEARIAPAGLAAIEEARRNGQWEAAYDGSRTMEVPPDFQAELDANPAARTFFEALDRANRYAFLYRIQTAKKPETRERRIGQFLEMLGRGEKLH
jgi:uncharacterized protein YdeI (YjbR/CyaY-like superfamily)